MRQLILAGMAPVEAARLAFDVETDVLTPMVLAPKSLEPPVDRLFSAALAFDLAAVKEGISNSLQAHGVAATWELLIAPLLIRMGEFWEESGKGVEVEHFLSEQIKSALLSNKIVLSDEDVRNGTPILLVSAPEEQPRCTPGRVEGESHRVRGPAPDGLARGIDGSNSTCRSFYLGFLCEFGDANGCRSPSLVSPRASDRAWRAWLA